MGMKQFTRLIAIFLVLSFCISSFPALAYDYPGGPKDYEMDRSMMLVADNVSMSGNTLQFNAGGSITFDIILPFDTNKLELKYDAPKNDVNIEVVTDSNKYKAVLAKESTYTAIDITEVSASRTITFTSDAELTLKGINFHKVNELYNDVNTVVAPFTPYQEKMLTLVALKCGIGVVKSRNCLLRWDPTDNFVNPRAINGKIYAPAKKLAEALLLYCEDYEDLSYLYMLGEFSSMSIKNGKGYYEDNENGSKEVELDVRYEDGQTWVPVRQIAELFGHTVGYKDGFVIIGDRLRVKNALEDTSLLNELQTEFNEFKVAKDENKGKTYYVAKTPNASDANSGTEEYPFLTIQKAADVAKEGDTVIIHEGTYRETVKVKHDGSSMAPVTFKAAEGEKVVISALEKISGFIEYKDDIVCASIPVDLGDGRNQLFYNGNQLMAGRHPNTDTKPGITPYPPEVPEGLYPTKGNIMITDQPHGDTAYSDTDLNQEQDDYWKGGLYVTLKGAGWSIATGDIVSSKKGMLKLKDHEGSKSFNLGIGGSERHGNPSPYYMGVHNTDFAYITNHINTVDIPGEWYMNDHILYLIPPVGCNVETDLEMKQRQLCIDLRDRRYVTFDGINTIGGSITGDGTWGCSLLNGEFKNIAHHTRQLDATNYTMYVDESSYSYESMKKGEAGIYFSGSYNTVYNCVIDESSAFGVAITDKHNYISNNVIKNCSYSGGYPGCIRVSADEARTRADATLVNGGHFITYNTLYNAGRAVYNVGSTTNPANGKYYGLSPIEFAYNRCFNGSMTARDTGVVYEYGHTGGNDVARATMHHNFVYDIVHVDEDTADIAMLVYHDGYTASRDTYSNITYYDDPTRPVMYTRGVWVQDPKWTILRCRNNSELGLIPEGEAGLDRADYPGGRMFSVGADHGEYAFRFMGNYEAHDNGSPITQASKVEQNEENKKQKFLFKDIDIAGDAVTTLTYHMSREYGITDKLDVVARVYDKAGNLVQESYGNNDAITKRFYVNDVHKGLIVLLPMDAGKYDVELELSDSYSHVYSLIPKTIDSTYDILYSKEDAEAGKICYTPAEVQKDAEKGTVTYSFEDVKFGGMDHKTYFNVHYARQTGVDPKFNITAHVYDQAGNLVKQSDFENSKKSSRPQYFEPFNGAVVVPELPEGTYDIKLELSDAYSHVIRIMPEIADPAYDNLFDRPDVFLGGSYDEWTKGAPNALDVSSSTNLTIERLLKFNYWAAGNCWDHTLYYKNRTVSEAADMIRVTQSTGGGLQGSKVSLYLDTLDSEPIATWTTEDTVWAAKSRYIDLERTLEPGEYTFIFKFEGANLCSTLWNFSFCNEKWEEDLAQ